MGYEAEMVRPTDVDSAGLTVDRKGGGDDSVVTAKPSTQAVTNTVGGIVLAGSQTWGACPLERVVPRPLAHLLNRPLIDHVLDWMGTSGVQSASICGNSASRMLKHAWSGHDGMHIDYCVDASPRGPAGGVRDAGLLSFADDFVVVEGTALPLIDLADLVDTHRRTGAALTVVVTISRSGVGEQPDDIRPRGIYVFARRALEHVPEKGYQDIKETLIPRLYQCGESVLTYRTDAPLLRVTGVDSYLAVHEWAMSHQLKNSVADHLNGPTPGSYIHESSEISSSARMIGPVLIGPGAVIEEGVRLVGPTSVGAQSRIESGSVVCRSSIWEDVKISTGAVLDRCVATNGAAVDAEAPHRYVVLS